VFDIKWIRDNPEAFDAGLKKRGIAPGGDVKFSAELLELDEQRRKVVTRLQEAQQRRNAASKEIGKAKAGKDDAKAAALMAEVNETTQRQCDRCGAAESRVQHSFGPWRYASEHDSRQSTTCRRCGAETFTRPGSLW